jgi:hypothetical protein
MHRMSSSSSSVKRQQVAQGDWLQGRQQEQQGRAAHALLLLLLLPCRTLACLAGLPGQLQSCMLLLEVLLLLLLLRPRPPGVTLGPAQLTLQPAS